MPGIALRLTPKANGAKGERGILPQELATRALWLWRIRRLASAEALGEVHAPIRMEVYVSLPKHMRSTALRLGGPVQRMLWRDLVHVQLRQDEVWL